MEQPSNALKSFGFYDDYKPILWILQEGLENKGALASLFFGDLWALLLGNNSNGVLLSRKSGV